MTRNVCTVPGCGRELWVRAVSGVCAKHNHHRDYCQCLRCSRARGDDPKAREPAPQPPPPPPVVAAPKAPPRPHIRVYQGISLPRAPWEREGME